MLGATPAGLPPPASGLQPSPDQSPGGHRRAATGANQLPVGTRPPFGNHGMFPDPGGAMHGNHPSIPGLGGPPLMGTAPPGAAPPPPIPQPGMANNPNAGPVPPPPTGSPLGGPTANIMTGPMGVPLPPPMMLGQDHSTAPPPPLMNLEPSSSAPILPLIPTPGQGGPANMQSIMQALFQGMNIPQKKPFQPMTQDLALPQSKTLYVNNIDDKIKIEVLKKELKAMFQNFGEIIDVIAMKSFWRRGQAWVIFKNQEAASFAMLKLQGFPYNRKPLRINFALAKSDVFAKSDGTFVPREAGPRKPRAIIEREKQLQLHLQEFRQESQRRAFHMQQQQESFQKQQRQEEEDELAVADGHAPNPGSMPAPDLPFKLTTHQRALADFLQQKRRRGTDMMGMESKPLLELPTNAVRLKQDGDASATGGVPSQAASSPAAAATSTGFSPATSTPQGQTQSQAGLVADLTMKAAAARDALAQRKRQFEPSGGDAGIPPGGQVPPFNSAAFAAAQAAATALGGNAMGATEMLSPSKKLKAGLMGMGFGAQPVPQKMGGGSNMPSLPHDKLMISDLPDDCTDMMLDMLFRQHSGYKEVRLIQGRHLAFAEFESVAHATAAMSGLQGMEIQEGVGLKISYAKR